MAWSAKMLAPWYVREAGVVMPSNMPSRPYELSPRSRGAAAVLDELGLSMPTAVDPFLHAAIRGDGIPFEVESS